MYYDFNLVPAHKRPEHKKPEHKKFIWWNQADGTPIKVKDMTISHLQNSIHKIQRDQWRLQWLEPLMEELESR